ncbi:hypothetical protein [Aquimarina muelleri]|uniref:Outer membrane protein beta-barrel domain-containing protein n=1 Tax=Aquimarina muelleri TaxID=279356 RepID=A0A918N2P5_9FLAO|nr:hypothetical protein [Aquimarina muelleri]MCX2762057.1 hypothetical protein [Aquimarina muelleri]GGX04122.1 hypothetical protein GCM10007384_02390 [Aquimarina muelleri]
MMKFIYQFSILSLLTIYTAKGQIYSKQENPWVLGIGVNIIYDSGSLFDGIFNIEDNYNYSTPIHLSIEKRFKDDYGFEISSSFNKFLVGKRINNKILDKNINIFIIDGAFKYYITNKYLNKYRAIYEGYLSIGGGSSFYDRSSAITTNLGIGINYYISESIRLNTQATGKISIDNSLQGSNYIQYNIGLIIRLQESNFN